MKYSSKTPMLGNRRQKVGKVIKSLLEKNQKVGKYNQYLTRLSSQDIIRVIKKCIKGNTKHAFAIRFNFDNLVEYYHESFPFVLFLTNKQINNYEYYEDFEEKYDLVMSNTQFHKTCFATILLNRDIHYYAKYEVLPPPPKIKRITPLLAIEMKNLINFDEEPVKEDLILSKTKPIKEDLIPSKTNKTQKTIQEIMEKNLKDFTKSPYERYTKKQNLEKIKKEALAVLVNEINYPLTKDILGLSLPNNLKEKISKLTSEAAVGLAWIIRALILTNQGKLPVYNYNNSFFQMSQPQIKETIEYFFSILAIILNPAQKN